MQYYSTRDINLNKTFEEIIIQSLCKSGGLYLPMDYPTLNYEEIFKNNPSYNDIAYSVLSNFIGSSIKDNDLKNIIKKTYDGFSCENSANLFNYAENKFILELFYGPTLAFKDYPLQLLGNVTASGNISSSGDVTASNIWAQALTVSESIDLSGDVTLGSSCTDTISVLGAISSNLNKYLQTI